MRRRIPRGVVFALGAALVNFACGARTSLRPSGDAETSLEASSGAGGTGTGSTSEPPPPQRELDKLDILLSVDDSISMADKQRLLEQAVPDLIGRLANPFCVDVDRVAFPDLTPPTGQPCPVGPRGQLLEREFLPVSDVHVGLVTSTLGKAGVLGAPTNQAHLLGSFRDGLPGMTEHGFLAWDADQAQAQFESEIATMMGSVGESGSGFEAPLEAWYRFLVEPAPYQELLHAPCPDEPSVDCVTEQGIDTELLAQRRAFLRPDSVVVIIVLSDEDDCSPRIEPTSWQMLSDGYPLERGTSACDTDPNDRCCVPCGLAPVEGCEADPACALDPVSHDDLNLRCFEQKRRYGREVLQPIERYRAALTQYRLCPERADLAATGTCSEVVDNPLFVDLERGGPAARTPEAVFLTFIVGVPWHDLAREPLRLLDPNADGLVYKSATEMDGDGTWELLLGDTLAPPLDPLMLTSVDPRSGIHPITGETIAGASAWPTVNSINGHDRTIINSDDLQYACTFPLPEGRDCAETTEPCDCTNPRKGHSPDNPMCQDPSTGVYSTFQHSGKAYPGQRHVALARELGDNAVLSSICARNTRDPTRADYAYRPTVAALVTRIAPILQQPE
ncbi:MAG TPA: hypothetical protein VFU02_13530 [Polyangiaceae bacterium]|nr:hypothetical protein [Polyangiaceae bacterium]